MSMSTLGPITPAALYARVSSDRQDVDLSVSGQVRALKEYANANGYVITREYVDEAETGRSANHPEFNKMLEEGLQPSPPFQTILVWKYNRFSRKRLDAVTLKANLRAQGIQVVSITEPASVTPEGELVEAVIEAIDEFYSKNLAVDVKRGMREAASRGFFMASRAPYGYDRVKVNDGGKQRNTLEVDPETAPIVREIFDKSLQGSGLKEICKELNSRGLTNKGKRWYKTGLYYVLTNEAYVGVSVWDKGSKGQPNPDPVRVEGAWEALITRDKFVQVQRGLADRAPGGERPAPTSQQFLLSGLIHCGQCGKPYVGQTAKSGRYQYYVCGTLHREGAGTCQAQYLNAERTENIVSSEIVKRAGNGYTIWVSTLVMEAEIEAVVREMADSLSEIDTHLEEVQRRLRENYAALESRALSLDDLAPRIQGLRTLEKTLIELRDTAKHSAEAGSRKPFTRDDSDKTAQEVRDVLEKGSFSERRYTIHNLVKRIDVDGDYLDITLETPLPEFPEQSPDEPES